MLGKKDEKKIEKDVLTEVLRLLDFIMTIVSKLKKKTSVTVKSRLSKSSTLKTRISETFPKLQGDRQID